MAVVASKLKTGTLTLGGTSYACQAKNVTFTPPDIPSGDDAEEVLCGDPLPSDDDASQWKLKITAVQDFDNPAGLIAHVLQNKGTEEAFTWTPNDTGFGASGTVKIWPGDVGGDVNKILESSLEFPITSGDPVWTFPTAP